MSKRQLEKLADLYTKVASAKTRDWIIWAVRIAYASAAVAGNNNGGVQ